MVNCLFNNKIYSKMETKHEVKMIEVDFLCPKCEKGNLRPNGNVS